MSVFSKQLKYLSIIAGCGLLGIGDICATDAPTRNAFRLGGIEVVGSKEHMQTIPGAAAVVDTETIALTQPLSIGDALRKVSGIYVRDEDGMGLRPNISIRGIDGHRSVKLLLLEDGLPVSLAPYGENSAYYAPLVDRAARLEVLKGAGSILYGPQTVAGVVNYITHNPPLKETTTATIIGGTNAYMDLRADYGTTLDSTGVLVQALHKRGDGLRSGTPFNIYDFRSKVVVALKSDQELTFRAQYFSEDSKISYVGLTQAMYEDNPNQNPAIHDNLYVERLGLSATHTHHQFFEGRLDTSFYGYVTKRDFWRQAYDRSDASLDYERISGNGEDLDSIFWKNSNNGNNRSYKVVGVEPRFESGDFNGGAKLHYEFEDTKKITGSTGDARTGTLAQDERRDTLATAVYAQNRYTLADNWDITLGLRIEAYRQGREVLASTTSTANTTGTEIEWIPGIGTTYTVDADTTVFAGVHRGFAPPKFADALNGTDVIDQQLDAERSWNYEAGVRTSFADAAVNITAFFYDYQNQIVNAAISSGVTKANAGKTQNLGLEADIRKEWALSPETKLYSSAVATYVDARQKQGTNDGKKLAYAPEYTGSVTTGIQHGAWDAALEMVYVGEMFSDDANTVEGSANGLVGQIPSHLVWNLSSRYTLDNMAFFATAKNILNTTYIASRRPEGIFPGAFQQILVGMTVEI